MAWKTRLAGLLMVAVMALAACGGETDDDSDGGSDEAASEESTPRTDSSSDDNESSENDEGTPSADGSNESEPPNISDGAISRTEKFIADDRLVKDAHIAVEGQEVRIALIVNAATTEDKAKQTLNNAARFLATQAGLEHERLPSPDAESLGGLWDHYDLQVMAGPGPREALVQGAKVTSARKITW